MPAAVPASTSTQLADKANLQKARPAKAQSRKKRAGRRRGARNDLESDEEIEREAASSESDDDDHHDPASSTDDESATDDSDTEPGSEDVPSHPPIPSSSKEVAVTHINGAVAPFFETSLTWSEMVADENDNGATGAGLPVIDFAEFNGASKIPARPQKKAQKQKHKKAAASSTSAAPSTRAPTQHTKPPAPAEAAATPAWDESPVQAPEPSKAPASPLAERKFGQSARQAYQERLEKDPAYVPTVGGFWNHDDRLMDKELRSLSGWWRGQWQGRGRGRGFGMRGGARAGHDSHPSKDVDPQDVPPVERAWTHDGFEEMKRKDEERQARQDSLANRGRGGFRGGRGGFAARGRGSFKNRFGGSPARGMPPLPGRVWFAMKPEHPWSQQSTVFLFPGPGRHGKPGNYRVKVPGKREQFARITEAAQTPKSDPEGPVPAVAEVKEVQYVVRLPSKKQEPQKEQPEVSAEAHAPVAEVKEETPAVPETAPIPSGSPVLEEAASSQPSPAVVSQLEQLSIDPAVPDPSRQAKMEEAVLRNPTTERLEGPSSATDQRPVLPPLQTVFTPPPPPVSQPSPVYGSPYTYPQQLPPGIALNHHGMPYEVATGRPVYLQHPPPPPMYNPQPLVHSQYAPPGMGYGHVRHPSAMSPDFLAQPPSHTPPMNGFIDPSTGTPLFSLPRPNARLEIRAPDGSHRSPTTKPASAHNRGPSKLRNTATAFEPMRVVNDGSDGLYPSINSNTPSDGNGLPPSYEAVNGGAMSDDGSQQSQQQPPMGHMMGYNPYNQPYYYPDGYVYPGAYMDMPQQQPGSYDGYGTDQGQQQAGYY
ncbi:hypothetical protein EST38_g444 [Candolleomyces aberdarensis]|uniref:Btz domain-containing protein n=1 Tax=Candolleomyces aberdarensis TaxID=2316362 RepID=A0A4Q2DXG0_9AGAR|nr:hypothetical protein EST38_g444 [Candolleomyces aberdarensis]